MATDSLDDQISGYTGPDEVKLRLNSWIKSRNNYQTTENQLSQQISDLESEIPEGATGLGIDLLNRELNEMKNQRDRLLTYISQMETCCQNLLTDFTSEQLTIIEEIKRLTDNSEQILLKIENLREHDSLRNTFFDHYPSSFSDQMKKIYLKQFFHLV